MSPDAASMSAFVDSYSPSPLETVSYILKRTTDEGRRDRHEEYINKLDEVSYDCPRADLKADR